MLCSRSISRWCATRRSARILARAGLAESIISPWPLIAPAISAIVSRKVPRRERTPTSHGYSSG